MICKYSVCELVLMCLLCLLCLLSYFILGSIDVDFSKKDLEMYCLLSVLVVSTINVLYTECAGGLHHKCIVY